MILPHRNLTNRPFTLYLKAVEDKGTTENGVDFPYLRVGPSFLCVISGTAIIWLFSFFDLILLGRIFNQEIVPSV